MKKIIATFILAVTALLCVSAYGDIVKGVFINIHNGFWWYQWVSPVSATATTKKNGVLYSFRIPESKHIGPGQTSTIFVDTPKYGNVIDVEVLTPLMWTSRCESPEDLNIKYGSLTVNLASKTSGGIVSGVVCTATLVDYVTEKTTHPKFVNEN